jgi:hypothetical protein
MRKRGYAKLPRRQGGWVGLIVLLLAVLVVGFLAKDALKQYGMLDAGTTVSRNRAPLGTTPGASGAALPSSVDGSSAGIESAPRAPTTPMDRARNLGATLQQQADERAKQMNAAER